MNSEPLSESIPMIGNGKTLMTCSRASKTHFAALFFTERFTVHPVLISVTVRVKQYSPDGVAAVVADEVDFDEPGHRVVPFGPGPDGDL